MRRSGRAGARGRQAIIENASIDTIADQLKNGYWVGDSRHFDVTQGGSITVSLGQLSEDEKFLARTALQFWTDITGITFVAGSKGFKAQIAFYDSEGADGPVAATSSNTGAGNIFSSTITISSSWVDNYGTDLDTYSLQTYVHEIGHALGLGHAGNYNVDATFATDALFSNDAWSTSIMSYFSQEESTYFSNLGFSYLYALTPMMADIVAIQSMYGLSTTTRTTDTIYGYHSNAGTVYDAVAYSQAAFTIFDSGGNDTIDYSGSSATQLINLNAETFSNVNGYVGNLAIARTVVIENAIGGSGSDTLIGNAVANVLTGNDGDDYLDGGAGADTLTGGAGNDRIVYDAADNAANVTGGAGTDTLVVIDQAAPIGYNLVAGGFEGAEVTLHDTGSNSWSSVVTNYNASWQALNQNMVNDDGSHSFTAFDFDSSQAWDQVWFTYNASGQQISEDYRYDDGKRSWVAIDAAGTQSWSQVWFTYNSAGQQISEDYRYDDGKRSWVSIDAANASNWAQVWFTYDVSGNKVSEDYRYDDNSRSWVAFDADNSKVWNNIWFTFDANGHQTSEDRTNDNGTRVWTAYDANSNLAWSTDAFYYDNTGHLYQSIRTWDDGHTTTTIF